MIATGRGRLMVFACAGSAAFLLLSGCDALFNNKLLLRHFSNEDKQAAARERWNAFRGDVRLQLAAQHLDAGRYDDAEKILTEARELSPERPEVHGLTARLYFETDRLQAAQRAVDEQLALAPADAEGLFLRGRIAERMGDSDAAATAYRAAFAAAPERLAYCAALAECLANRGEAEEALRAIVSAGQYETSLPLRKLAMEICHAHGRPREAAAHARAVYRLAADDADAQIRAGLILASCGEDEDAAAILGPHVDDATAALDRTGDEAMNGAPFREEMLIAYARSCLALDRSAAALKSLKPLLGRDAADELAWSLYCRSALRSGDLDLALRTIETFNRRNKPIPEMLVLQAYVRYLGGDADAALELADRALAIDASFEPAHLIKARAALDRGHANKATASLLKAALDAPNEAARRKLIASLAAVEESAGDTSFVDRSYVAASDEEGWD